PWVGAMRTTDAAGTRSMTNLRTDGFSVNAETPLVLGYDPAGTRYGQMWAVVDPVNGTTTASAAMVATTLAGAKAVAAASKPRDVSTAVQAGYLANRTLAAANCQASQTRSVDGMFVVLPSGTSTMGATAVTTGIAAPEIPVRIMGDPDDASARTNSVLNLTVAGPNIRVTRLGLSRLSLGLGTNALATNTTALFWIDDVTGTGRSGLEANTVPFSSASPTAGQFNLFITRSRWWRHGVGLTGGNLRAGLARGNEFSRQTQALAFLKNRFIGNVEDSFIGTGAQNVWGGWGAPTLAGQVEDIVIKWNDMRFARGRTVAWTYLPAATAGTPNPSLRRHVVAGNVMERIGTDPQPFYAMGEDVSATMSYNIIEANTHAGERANTFYSDPLPATLAECDAQLNQAFVNRVAGNAYDWLPTKHDDFSDPTAQSLRVAAGGAEVAKAGYRPQMIEAWSMLYGVGHEANVDCRRINVGTEFALEFYGLRSIYTASAQNPAFADDRSNAGTGAGGGNYVPGSGTVLAGRVQNGQADVDFAGAARGSGSAVGAWRGPMAVALAPDNARNGQMAGATTLALRLTLTPQAARSAQQAGTSTLSLRLGLAPQSARSTQQAGAPALALRLGLAPHNARSGQAALASSLGLQLALAPRSARSGQSAAAPALALRLALAPLSARSGQSASSPVLALAGAGLLQPAGARHGLRDAGTVPLLPAVDLALVPMQAVGPARQTLLVPKAF
ncbi:MAG: hypothetical protein WCO82_07375, partial [Sphingomonadales bacterium]